MKKVLIAIVLAAVLVMALAIPAFADKGGIPNGSASDQALGIGWGQEFSNSAHLDGPLGQDVSEVAQADDERPGVGDFVQYCHDLIRAL